MVDRFSDAFNSFISELNTIGNKGHFAVQPKLRPSTTTPINLTTSFSSSATGNTDIDRLMRAIKQQESGGNYSAYNSMYGASGAYQILKSHIEGPGGWDKTALGRDISYNDFMNTPSLQDSIAKYYLSQYLQKYGAAGAAVAWYGGEGAVKNMHSKATQRGGYPSLYEYWNSVLSKM